MSDLADRLREEYCNCIPAYKDRGMVDPHCESCQTLPERIEAADEINRLRALLATESSRKCATEHDCIWQPQCGSYGKCMRPERPFTAIGKGE